MTIREAIHEVHNLKPNTYTDSEIIDWLSNVERMIKREIIDTHEGAENIHFDGYNDNTDCDTVLIAEEPYDDLYIHWLESKIDYANGEMTKYNNSITRFNDVYTAFSKYYNRQNLPKNTRVKYF